MRIQTLALIIAGTLGLAGAAVADGQKIAVVNIQRVLAEAPHQFHDFMEEIRDGRIEVGFVHKGLDDLLATILLQADVLELKANPKAEASGPIIESRLDVGRGPVATMLVQRGTLRPGDAVVAGDAWGKVRALLDEIGRAHV